MIQTIACPRRENFHESCTKSVPAPYLNEARAAAKKTSCAKQNRVVAPPSPKLPRSAASAKIPTRTIALNVATDPSLVPATTLSGLHAQRSEGAARKGGWLDA